ncbi:hypothetical protein [Pelagicoccus mobilis]|uniref:Uncharacterized protein n=1 Tax=Pelagicoccus mobilis TaxID=415221 RepID=A0A934VRP1_9BACT|nr:hypothetical protein [Pelagicoccus mobilis]MBK1877823.1 hypothetical protein [Pelagicoccus mobilis]
MAIGCGGSCLEGAWGGVDFVGEGEIGELPAPGVVLGLVGGEEAAGEGVGPALFGGEVVNDLAQVFDEEFFFL